MGSISLDIGKMEERIAGVPARDWFVSITDANAQRANGFTRRWFGLPKRPSKGHRIAARASAASCNTFTN